MNKLNEEQGKLKDQKNTNRINETEQVNKKNLLGIIITGLILIFFVVICIYLIFVIFKKTEILVKPNNDISKCSLMIEAFLIMLSGCLGSSIYAIRAYLKGHVIDMILKSIISHGIFFGLSRGQY